jgi:NTE family protein
VGTGQGPDGPVGLVLAGGGARGAYEIGGLSALLPALEARGERPRVIVGTSVGAVNAAFLAATAQLPVDEVVARGQRIWRELRYEQVLRPLASPGAARRLAGYVGQFLGVPKARLLSLLDPAPLRGTVRDLIDFGQLECNVTGSGGELDAAAVVATSALTSRSVVFHRGGGSPARDDDRGIDYVDAAGPGGEGLTAEHVLASSAIPGVFPAVHVAEPTAAQGWYFDGGTRLNTPIKPALVLGARGIVVIGLNSIAPPSPGPLAGERRPDALEGAAQLVQAVLVDPLAHDVKTLASKNELIGPTKATAPGKLQVPYIFVAPQTPEAIGRRAQAVYAERYACLARKREACDLAILGHALAGGSDPLHGELLSYLFFAPEFARELIELGHADACRWLAAEHDGDGPWQVGPLPPPPAP